MSDTKVGTLIDETAKRDAIHIAVAPVVSGGNYRAGEHVGFMPDGRIGIRAEKKIGIVDPFLESGVQTNERCWIFLYPQTVTGMRHHWSHPAFTQEPVSKACDKLAAEQALLRFADRIGCAYNGLLNRLDLYADDSCGGDDDIQGGLNGMDELLVRQMWDAYELVRGVKVSDEIKGNTWFRCAC